VPVVVGLADEAAGSVAIFLSTMLTVKRVRVAGLTPTCKNVQGSVFGGDRGIRGIDGVHAASAILMMRSV
jgi:hypothetical protein